MSKRKDSTYRGGRSPDWLILRRRQLGELGWIEGRTIAIEYRWSEGRPERHAEIAAEFVRARRLAGRLNG